MPRSHLLGMHALVSCQGSATTARASWIIKTFEAVPVRLFHIFSLHELSCGPICEVQIFSKGHLETENTENQIDIVGSPEGGRQPGTQVSAAFLSISLLGGFGHEN